MDINVKGDTGTALHEAALFGRKAIVTLLLDCGVDAFARNSVGQASAMRVDLLATPSLSHTHIHTLSLSLSLRADGP